MSTFDTHQSILSYLTMLILVSIWTVVFVLLDQMVRTTSSIVQRKLGRIMTHFCSTSHPDCLKHLGAGKSTLLKLLTGEVDPTTGDVRRNPRLRMGIYNQHFVDRLPMNKTPVEHLRDRYDDLDYQTCRNRLGKYGLEGHAHEVVMRDLSGGQKARVVFVDLSLQMPHILLLE